MANTFDSNGWSAKSWRRPTRSSGGAGCGGVVGCMATPKVMPHVAAASSVSVTRSRSLTRVSGWARPCGVSARVPRCSPRVTSVRWRSVKKNIRHIGRGRSQPPILSTRSSDPSGQPSEDPAVGCWVSFLYPTRATLRRERGVSVGHIQTEAFVLGRRIRWTDGIANISARAWFASRQYLIHSSRTFHNLPTCQTGQDLHQHRQGTPGMDRRTLR